MFEIAHGDPGMDPAYGYGYDACDDDWLGPRLRRQDRVSCR